MDRTNLINDRLTNHFRDDLNLAVLSVDRETWAAADLKPRYRFGWHPPLPVPDGLLVMFCAELLSQITDDLDDSGFDTYLTAVEAIIDGHVWKRNKLPSSEIEPFIENMLHTKAPKSFQVFMEVEARAMDKGIVATL